MGSYRKSYLNTNERTRLFMLASFQTFLERTIAGIEELQELRKQPSDADKRILKNLRTSRTFVKKAISDMIEPLSEAEQDLLIKQAPKYTIVMKTNDQALRERKEMLSKNDTVVMPKGDFLDMAASAVCDCVNCNGANCDKCALRRIFMENEVEPINYSPAPGECQYAYKDIKECSLYDVVENGAGFRVRVAMGITPAGFKTVIKGPLKKKYWKLPVIRTQ